MFIQISTRFALLVDSSRAFRASLPDLASALSWSNLRLAFGHALGCFQVIPTLSLENKP